MFHEIYPGERKTEGPECEGVKINQWNTNFCLCFRYQLPFLGRSA